MVQVALSLDDQWSDTPWNRRSWTGSFLSLDGSATDDFKREDIARIVAYGETDRADWDGKSAGIVELKDGRFCSWESWWGPTGSGFHCDAYGGTADIAFAKDFETALRHISEQTREILVVV